MHCNFSLQVNLQLFTRVKLLDKKWAMMWYYTVPQIVKYTCAGGKHLTSIPTSLARVFMSRGVESNGWVKIPTMIVPSGWQIWTCETLGLGSAKLGLVPKRVFKSKPRSLSLILKVRNLLFFKCLSYNSTSKLIKNMSRE